MDRVDLFFHVVFMKVDVDVLAFQAENQDKYEISYRTSISKVFAFALSANKYSRFLYPAGFPPE